MSLSKQAGDSQANVYSVGYIGFHDFIVSKMLFVLCEGKIVSQKWSIRSGRTL